MGPDSQCCALLLRLSPVLTASPEGNFAITRFRLAQCNTLNSSRDAADLRVSGLYDVRPPPDGELAR